MLLDEQQTAEMMPFCIIHPFVIWKTIWNFAMMILIIFLAILVPYRIPFDDGDTMGWIIIDILIDTLFEIDMILNFHTAIENENGELVTDRLKIAVSYFKGWFIIDLLSSIPITLI